MFLSSDEATWFCISNKGVLMQETMQVQPPWHNQSKEETLKELNATVTGLSQTEAQARLSVYGFNRLPEVRKRNALLRFLLQFNNILIYALLGSAIITAALNHILDTVIILFVLVTNAIIGFIQEGKSEKAMDAIRQMLAPQASVLRNGERYSIEGDRLVPGDIVLLTAGDKVPADLRLLSAHGMSIDEAILTGESVPVEKQVQPVAMDASLGDRSCMAFSGTLVTMGQGKGVVVATGGDTEIGRISGLLSEVKTLTTPLLEQMAIFAKWVTFLILLIAILLLIYGYFVIHYNFTEIFMVVIALSVSAIPEGLPAVLTITLAIGVQSMAKRHAIVRRLPAIETLGSVSVICTDKTGTLTRNEMMVTSVVTHQNQFTIEGEGYNPKGMITLNGMEVDPGEFLILNEIARTATLCNDATLKEHENVWSVEGDPMEGALLAFSSKIGMNIHQEQTTWKRTDTIPFDAKHCFMATLLHDHEHQAHIFVKGAPEQILKMCHNQRSINGTVESLNKDYWNKEIETIAALGQRVLAFAVRSVKPEHTVLLHHEITGTLTLLGVVGMIDPPRSEAITAVAQCRSAGIRVKMITGDHAKTAAAIAKQIKLQNPNTVLTGIELDSMNDVALKEAIINCDIFARTSPEHKLRIVMALQSHDMIVAMTGDGVNDAPALKRADAGIAMGKKGSEAAKEASELVLADDNFTSIVAAVQEGRTVYDNIKKVISWTLPTNAGEAMTIIVALLFGITIPLTPIQILWVNLITTVTLGIALAFEPMEENTMHRPPRPRNEPLIGSELVWHIILVSILFLCGVFAIFNYALDRGYSINLARTIALNTLVVLEIFHLFFIRNIYGTSLTWQAVCGTKLIWAVVIIIVIAQFSITYLTPLQVIFATESISFFDGVLIISVGVAMFAIIEIEKQIRLRLKRMNVPNVE